MYHAKNGKLTIDNDDMYYVSFGSGKKPLVVLPGLGDGLKTAKGMALPIAMMYRKFAKDYKVYMFSRRNNLPEIYTSRQMAADVKKAMDVLGIGKADLMGVSQGGTIAQFVAIDYPEAVDKLVLTVTFGTANETLKTVIGKWIEFAMYGNYADIFIDNLEKANTEEYLKKVRRFYPLLTKITAPKNLERFIIQAKACIAHDASRWLEQISCPTLIIGGKQDKIVTAEASVELSKVIKNSCLHMYEDYGHALYEEAEDFQDVVLNFLKK